MKGFKSILFVCVVSLFVAACVSPATAFADEYKVENGGDKITCGETVYYRHYLPVGYYRTNWRQYYLQDSFWKDSVWTSTDPANFMFTDFADKSAYYDASENDAALLLFYNGLKGGYCLSDNDILSGTAFDADYSVFDEAYDRARENNTTDNVWVRDLSALTNVKVVYVDETETFYTVHGEFYISGDKVYYLFYDRLPNDRFDADGAFSYRRGSVSALRLDDDLKARFYAGYDRFERFPNVYVSANGETLDSPDISGIVSLVVFGVALPVAIGAVSLVFYIKRRRSGSRLLPVAIGAAVWLAAGVAMLVIAL